MKIIRNINYSIKTRNIVSLFTQSAVSSRMIKPESQGSKEKNRKFKQKEINKKKKNQVNSQSTTK